MRLEFPLPHSIDPDTADELVKESAYISKDIRAFRVEQSTGVVVVDLAEHTDAQAVAGKVERYISMMLRGYRGSETKIYLRNTRKDSGPIDSCVYDQLRQRQWLFEIGVGHVGFAGPALRLMEYIDSFVASLYREHFGAVDRSFPALIRSDILARCGYLESHPNNVTLVTHLIEDFDAIEAFRLANLGLEPLRLPDPAALAEPHTCLNPAACFPVYYTLENQSIPSTGMCLTWLGRVFRYESKNITTLERLWEFNVRELVFLGDADSILQKRDQAVALIGDIARAFDLEMFVQLATDPFFATVAAAKKLWQQSMESKYEIRLVITDAAEGGSRSIAAGSINVHGTFFGDRFAISTDSGSAAYTACVGLGIERLVFAAFAQHGFDPVRWPEPIRRAIF